MILNFFCVEESVLRRQPNSETDQIKAFLRAGHPWLAFAVKLVPTVKLALMTAAAFGMLTIFPEGAKPIITLISLILH